MKWYFFYLVQTYRLEKLFVFTLEKLPSWLPLNFKMIYEVMLSSCFGLPFSAATN